MLREMFSPVLMIKVLILISIISVSYGCNDESYSSNGADEKSQSERYSTTPSQMNSLRDLVVTEICKEPDLHRLKNETVPQCEDRVRRMILECETEGELKTPEDFGASGDEFSQYAQNAIRCIEG